MAIIPRNARLELHGQVILDELEEERVHARLPNDPAPAYAPQIDGRCFACFGRHNLLDTQTTCVTCECGCHIWGSKAREATR